MFAGGSANVASLAGKRARPAYSSCALLQRPRAGAVARRALAQLAKALVDAALLSLGAKLKFSLPLTPVPFTLQTMFLTYVILIRGRQAWRGVAAYLAAGLAGLPAFAYGGGPWYVASPTFGYLLGFLCAAVLVGRGLGAPLRPWSAVVAGLKVVAIVYAAGVAWLAGWYALAADLGPLAALLTAALTGAAPFVAWDVAKALAAVAMTFATRALSPALRCLWAAARVALAARKRPREERG